MNKLIVVLAFVCLVGTGVVFSGGQKETKEKVVGPQTIKIWTPGILSSLEDQAKRFQKEYPGIEVETTSIPFEAFYEKLIPAILSGKGPDIFRTHAGQVTYYVEMGLLKAAPDEVLADAKKRWLPEVVKMWSREGKLYGIQDEQYSLGLIYNKDMFKEAGVVSPPETWDELRELAIKLTTKDSSGKMLRSGYAVIIKDNDIQCNWWSKIFQMGGKLVDPEGIGGKSHFNSAISVEALRYFYDLVWKYGVNDVKMPVTWEAFENKQAAMLITEPGFTTKWEKQFPDLNYGISHIPTHKKGEKPVYVDIGRWGWSIVDSKNYDKISDAAWKWFEFANTKDEYVRVKIDNRSGYASTQPAVDKDPKIKEFLSTRSELSKWSAFAANSKWTGDVVQLTIILRVIQPILEEIWYKGATPEQVCPRIEQACDKFITEPF